jgi:hypothetical protein
MIATMDTWQADAVVVGEGHAPLWQYFARLRKKGRRAGAMMSSRTPNAPTRAGWGEPPMPRCGGTCDRC